MLLQHSLQPLIPMPANRQRLLHLLLLPAAVLLTLATLLIQTRSATQVVVGEGFCSTMEACEVPALGGGFPIPYLVDNPQISVPNSIHFVEDDFRLSAFLLDLSLIFIALLIGLRMASR